MGRIKPEMEIKNISIVIEKNIEAHKSINDRSLLCQNILAQMRNLVEDAAIVIYNKENATELDSHYENVEISMDFVRGIKKYKYLKEIHKYLQSTSSHYTPKDSDAEMLVLYYYRYLCEMKITLKDEINLDIINNIDEFPIYDDALTKKHYEIICDQILQVKFGNQKLQNGRFYIQKTKPIFSKGKVYFEYTITKATNYNNKFERILVYSNNFIPNNYAIKFSYEYREIDIFSSKSKIKVINNYEISIIPRELKKIAQILGLYFNVTEDYKEYNNLMSLLKTNDENLLSIIVSEDILFKQNIEEIHIKARNNHLSNMLLVLRERFKQDKKGNNILKYLIHTPRDKTIEDQYDSRSNQHLDNLFLKNSAIPFDSMPYAMSPAKHNSNYFVVSQAIDLKGHEYELLGKEIRYNSENKNILYTPLKELEMFPNIEKCIEEYNNALVEFGIDRELKNQLILENGFVYIKAYEKNSIEIITKLKEYRDKNNTDIKTTMNIYNSICQPEDITEDKKKILSSIFQNNCVAIIHGSAGTGKTKMLELLADALSDYKKIFISNTTTSVSNLRNRIDIHEPVNSEFSTAYNYINNIAESYEILIVDESSVLSNDDMLKILQRKYKLIILAGDTHQIESIKYGDWFTFAHRYFSNEFVFELDINNRTTQEELIVLWDLVRKNDKDAINKLSNNQFSSELNEDIFLNSEDDEIILCLNYDGLYGINNINKFLQERNPNKEYSFGVDIFKVDDPIVFNDCPRFKDLHNNLKGWIKDIVIQEANDNIVFTILVDTILSGFTAYGYEIIGYYETQTLIKFSVARFKDNDDEETDYNHIIPFNLAYAISIHKAQGLEYNSVKIIINSSVEDNITKNIFYTAITRTKKHLKIYWKSETCTKIFDNFKKETNSRDMAILTQKINKK